MSFYRRNLPHWQPPGGAKYFITFRLKGSIPRKIIEELKALRNKLKNMQETNNSFDQRSIQSKIFEKYEKILDAGKKGPVWLKKSKVANVVQKAIHYRDSKEYDLFAYCIMANHVHLVFQHLCDKTSLQTSKRFPLLKLCED